jgi:NADPH2:quinone reductase
VADRVRVRVHAAGLNHADILQRRGSYPAPPGYPQNIPGLEFAGEVEAIGDAVGAWKIGDRVFGIIAGGAQAELVVVPESNLARVPAQLSWGEAGAMPEVFITAHDALFTRAGLQMGHRVLVHAVASGVGTAAVQLAHAVGATVYGTSRNADKLNRMRELKLGMDESVAVGDAPAKFVEAVQKWTNGAGVDVISTLSAAVISRPAWKRSPCAVGLFQSALRPARNRKSILACSSESAPRLSGQCFAHVRSRRKPTRLAALPPLSCPWYRAAGSAR